MWYSHFGTSYRMDTSSLPMNNQFVFLTCSTYLIIFLFWRAAGNLTLISFVFVVTVRKMITIRVLGFGTRPSPKINCQSQFAVRFVFSTPPGESYKQLVSSYTRRAQAHNTKPNNLKPVFTRLKIVSENAFPERRQNRAFLRCPKRAV